MSTYLTSQKLLAASPQRYREFLRVSSLSVGIYVLDGGALDHEPHSADEVYYVASGRGRMRLEPTEMSRPLISALVRLSSCRLACNISFATSPNGWQYWCSSALRVLTMGRRK